MTLTVQPDAAIENIVLGYACINQMYKKHYSCNHTTTEKALVKLDSSAAAKRCKKLALQNLESLYDLLGVNEYYGIRFFRITSELFPHCGNPRMQELCPQEDYFKGNIVFAYAQLKKIGDYANAHNHRLDFHSSAFNQMATPDTTVWDNTLFDLKMYYVILSHMGIEPMHRVIFHIGGVYHDQYGTKEVTMEKWIERYQALDDHIKALIIVENDEWHYGAKRVLPFCEKYGIPMVFDFHHNTQSLDEDRVTVTHDFLDRVCATWKDSCIDPKFHLSEQKPDGRRGAHSDYVEVVPKIMLEYARLHPGRKYYMMLEAKEKEQAVFRLLDNYCVTHLD
jgi:UV DNA damage endonuclease